MTQIAQVTVQLLENGNTSDKTRWNYGERNFIPRKIGFLGICGHNSKEHLFPHYSHRLRDLIYVYNVPLWWTCFLKRFEEHKSQFNMLQLCSLITSYWAIVERSRKKTPKFDNFHSIWYNLQLPYVIRGQHSSAKVLTT